MHRSIVVPVKSATGYQLIKGFDVRLWTVSTIAGSRSIQRRLDRSDISRGRRSDNGLIENKRSSGGVFRCEVRIFFESAYPESKIGTRRCSLQRSHDIRERAADDRTVAHKTSGVVEEQEHVDHVCQTAGVRQRQRNILTVALSSCQGGCNRTRSNQSSGWITGTRRPNRSTYGIRRGARITGSRDRTHNVATWLHVDEGIRTVAACNADRLPIIENVIAIDVDEYCRARNRALVGVTKQISVRIDELRSANLRCAVDTCGVDVVDSLCGCNGYTVHQLFGRSRTERIW